MVLDLNKLRGQKQTQPNVVPTETVGTSTLNIDKLKKGKQPEPAYTPQPLAFGINVDQSPDQPQPTLVSEVDPTKATPSGGVVRGAARLPLGVAHLTERLLSKLSNEEYKFATDWIARNEQYIKDNNLEGEALVGEIASALLAGGGLYSAGIKGAVKLGASEGVIEAVARKGAGDSDIQAIGQGILAGTLAGGVTGVVNKLSGNDMIKLYDYMKRQENITEEEATTIFNNWSKIMDAADTPRNRVKAIVDNLGEKGKVLVESSAVRSPSATREIEKNVKLRRKELEDLTKTDTSVTDMATVIDDGIKVVKDNYKDVKSFVSDKPITRAFNIPDALEEATTGDVAELRKLLNKEELTTKDLVDAAPTINSLIRKTKGSTQNEWTKVKNLVNKELEGSLTPREFKLWQSVNEDYRKMSEFRDSKLGDLVLRSMSKVGKREKLTPKAAMDALTKAGASDDIFKNLEFLVGSQKAAQFEKLVIGEALRGSTNVSWEALSKTLSKKGFVTEEGKALQNIVEQMKESFATDNHVTSLAFQNGSTRVGWGDNLINLIRYSIVGRMMASLVKNIPFSEVALHSRRMDDLERALRSPTKLKELELAMGEISEPVRRDLIESTIKQLAEDGKLANEAPALPYKREGTVLPEGDKPLYSTAEGTVAETPTQAMVGQEQPKAILNSLILKAGGGTDLINDLITKDKMIIPKLEKSAKELRRKQEVLTTEKWNKALEDVIRKEVSSTVRRLSGKKRGRFSNKEKEEVETMVKNTFNRLLREEK